MEANKREPNKTPSQDQIAVLCITVVGLIVLIVLKVNASNYVDTLITMAELALPAASALARLVWQLLHERNDEQNRAESEVSSTHSDGALDEPRAQQSATGSHAATGCGRDGQNELGGDADA